MSTNVTFNGTTYAIPASGELNWSSLASFLLDVGQHAALATSGVHTLRIATASPVTVAAATDYTVITKLTVPAAVAVTLPAGVAGQIFVIVDGTADAATNNVTITPNGAETIGGSATKVVSHNGGGVIIQYSSTGTDWKILNEFRPNGTIVNADVSATAAIAGSKLVAAASGVAGAVSTGTQTFTGAKTFETSVAFATSGGTPAALADYESGTLTYSNTADWTVTKTITIYFARIGNLVIMTSTDTTTGTSATTSLNLLDATAFPARLRPTRQNETTVGGVDNGAANAMHRLRVRTTTVDVIQGIGGGNWTASGTKTLYPFSICYLIN